jgi:hypothetical protein
MVYSQPTIVPTLISLVSNKDIKKGATIALTNATSGTQEQNKYLYGFQNFNLIFLIAILYIWLVAALFPPCVNYCTQLMIF